jgi:tRNA1(Val) A37 N6-methylase TrmN6
VIPADATTVDAFLGGRFEAVQPKHGHHRSGMEAVLLSAAIPASFKGAVIDLGAGVGVAGMAVAVRCPETQVVLVERDAEAVACCRAALARPLNQAFAGRVSIVAADIAALDAYALHADALVMNPPFYERERGTHSPKAARASAHVLAEDGLAPWLRAASLSLKPGGLLVVIFRADRLNALLEAASNAGYGRATILPIHPREGKAADRVLVSFVHDGGDAQRTLPPLHVHPPAGSAFQPALEAILRHGAGLAEVHPIWSSALA